jgi:hypothetical protein
MPWGAGLSQVLSTEQDGSDARLLSQIAPVNALSWTSALPGGDATMTCGLTMPLSYRPTALRLGRRVKVFRGAETVWRGTLAAPTASATGWTLTANGIGTDGNSYRAEWDENAGAPPNGQGVYSLDLVIDRAIGRGLPWVRQGTLQAGVPPVQRQDSCSQSVTEAMNAWLLTATQTWEITRKQYRIRVFPLPSKPTRLIVIPDPPSRTVAGYYNAMYLRYTFAGGGTPAWRTVLAEQPGSIRRYGRLESSGDWSSSGLFSDVGGVADPRPATWARGLLDAYQATSYTNAFAVIPGQVLTLGGTPVDLGMEKAGEVYKVVGATVGWGGEEPGPQPVFLGGGYAWDDMAETASITPFQTAAASLSGLLQSMQPAPPAPTAS